MFMIYCILYIGEVIMSSWLEIEQHDLQVKL